MCARRCFLVLFQSSFATAPSSPPPPPCSGYVTRSGGEEGVEEKKKELSLPYGYHSLLPLPTSIILFSPRLQVKDLPSLNLNKEDQKEDHSVSRAYPYKHTERKRHFLPPTRQKKTSNPASIRFSHIFPALVFFFPPPSSPGAKEEMKLARHGGLEVMLLPPKRGEIYRLFMEKMSILLVLHGTGLCGDSLIIFPPI